MRRSSVVTLALVGLCSALAVLFGFGWSYQSFITPKSNNGQLISVHGDGWAEEGAELHFRDLAPRGNRVEIDFSAWKPAGVPDNLISIALCGKKIDEFVLTTDTVRQLYLTGSCEPRTLTITGSTSFHGSPTDRRNLIAQIRSVKVSSRLGVPLISLDLLLIGLGLTLSAAILVWLAAEQWPWGAAALLVPLGATQLIGLSSFGDFRNVIAVWICVSALALGVVLGQSVKAERVSKPKSIPGGLTRWQFAVLAAVIGCGAAIRFYGLDFGLPANYHPDEVPKVNAIMRMVEYGDLNPRYFLHPSLLLYSTYAMNKLLQLFDIGWSFRDSAFLAGRIVSALAGSLSLLLLFAVGRRLFDSWTGIFGAALLAAFPLHVTCSRYLKEDALLTFLILACAITVIRAVQEDRRWLLLVAGGLAGLAAGTKYSGLLCGALVASAPWLRSRSIKPDVEYLFWSAGAIALMPIGFLCTTPYALLDSTKFLKDFGSERKHMIRGHTTTVTAWSQFWMYHFERSLKEGMTFIALTISTIAVGFLARRRRIEDLYIVVLVLLFYLPAEYVRAKPAPQPERYILPCLPFLALAAAQLVQSLRRSRWVFVASLLGLAVFIAPLIRSVELAGEVIPDTRTQMHSWMIANLPPGSKIYMDWKPYAPRFFHNEFEVTYILRSEILQHLDPNNLKRSGQDYLLLSGLFYDRYFKEPNSPASIRQRFRDLFDRVPIVIELMPKYGTYGFHNPSLTLFSLKADDFARLESELALRAVGEISETSNQVRARFKWLTAKD